MPEVVEIVVRPVCFTGRYSGAASHTAHMWVIWIDSAVDDGDFNTATGVSDEGLVAMSLNWDHHLEGANSRALNCGAVIAAIKIISRIPTDVPNFGGV
jgi:hypothetical protein